MLNEVELLVWAAGGPEPASPAYDEPRLLAAMQAHQLEVRFAARLGQRRPPWASASLVAAATELARAARVSAERQLDTYRELLLQTSPAARPLLSKGLSYHLLTGDERLIKRCGDLDLFSRDPRALRDELVALGWTVDGKMPPQPSGRAVFHEFAKLHRGAVEVDLHSRFPVWRYPDVGATAVSPLANPGAWACPHSVERHELSTASLYGSVVRRTHGGMPLPVTGPAMTVLVSCCHVFANFLTEFRRPYGTLRLNELACVAEQIADPAFNWPALERLAVEHEAVDAVAYALALADRWLGVARRAPAGARWPGDPAPPHALWFARGEGGFLVAVGEPPEDLLVRATPAAEIVARLGGTTIAADGRWHTTGGGLAGEPVERVLSHGCHPVRFAAEWVDRGLRVTVEPECAPRERERDVLLWLGGEVIEAVQHAGGEVHAYERIFEQRLDPDDVLVERGGIVTVPSARLPEGDVALLLGARLWQPDGAYPSGATLVPLVIGAARS